MQWKDILNHRRKAVLTLVSVFLMVLMISIINKTHLRELQQSITSVYEDRLVAENHIFHISQHIHKKKILLNLDKNFIKAGVIDQSLDTLIRNYEATELTPEEISYFNALKKHIRTLEQFETKFSTSTSETQSDLWKARIEGQYDSILYDLEKLSEIQLDEGKKIVDRSGEIIASNNLTLRLEIGLLVVIALLIHMIINSTGRTTRKYIHSKDLSNITSNLN